MKTRVLLSTVCALAFTAASAQAATFSATIGGETFTVVEADPFKSLDTPDNTLGVVAPANFWGSTSTSQSDSLWRERAVSGFATGYESLAGATDRTNELEGGDLANAPELVTTVSGLAAGQYDVYVVYITRNDANIANGTILADLGGTATTLHDETNDEFVLAAGSNVWDVSLSQVGTTTDNATSFNVQVAGGPGPGRTDYIGVAYQLVPEPGSLALLGLGGLAVLRRRRA